MNQPLDIDALEDLALQLRRVAHQDTQKQSQRFFRPGVLAIVAALAVAGTATGTALLLTDGDPVPAAPRGDFSADQQPLPETARLSGVQTADPVGGLPWGLQLYRNASGQQCFIAGRIKDGRIGVVRFGVFHELPLRGPGNCAYQLERFGYAMHGSQSYVAGEEPRTLIYGILTPRVLSITFDDGITSKTIEPGPDGAYLAVFEGYDGVIKRILHFADGTDKVLIPQPTANP